MTETAWVLSKSGDRPLACSAGRGEEQLWQLQLGLLVCLPWHSLSWSRLTVSAHVTAVVTSGQQSVPASSSKTNRCHVNQAPDTWPADRTRDTWTLGLHWTRARREGYVMGLAGLAWTCCWTIIELAAAGVEQGWHYWHGHHKHCQPCNARAFDMYNRVGINW